MTKEIKNVLILDKVTRDASIVISEPESVTNIGEVMDTCQLVIRMTFSHDEQPNYYLCTRPDGSTYKSSTDLGG